ncbi:MAG: hypothetical protein ACLFQX_13260 [Candidatus Kapaibacterium sp.]
MRKILILIFMIAISATAYSQDGMQTLFGDEGLKSGGYGGPELKMTQAQGGTGLLVGGRGGWIINSTISVGGGGYGLVTEHPIENYFDVTSPYYGKDAYLRYGYGGFIVEYINNSNSLVHFTANMLIGGGGASYTHSFNDIINHNDHDWRTLENTTFFVFEPAVMADINITSFFRIGVGASYRLVSGVELSQTTNEDIGGFSGNMIFKFGAF